MDRIWIDVKRALCAPLGVFWIVLGLGAWIGDAAAEPAAGPAVATPSDTMAHAIQAVLREASNPKLRWGQFSDVRADLEQLYRERQHQPLWIHEGKATAQALEITDALGHAELQGLRNDDYDGGPLRQALQRLQPGTSQAEIAQIDAALSIAAARYATNVYAGRINPRNVDYGLTLESKKLDVADTLKRLAASRHPRLDLDALAPKLRVYKNLQDALVRYRELAKTGKTVELRFPAKFEPGKSHPDVPKLREILVGFGELSAEQAADPFR